MHKTKSIDLTFLLGDEDTLKQEVLPINATIEGVIINGMPKPKLIGMFFRWLGKDFFYDYLNESPEDFGHALFVNKYVQEDVLRNTSFNIFGLTRYESRGIIHSVGIGQKGHIFCEGTKVLEEEKDGRLNARTIEQYAESEAHRFIDKTKKEAIIYTPAHGLLEEHIKVLSPEEPIKEYSIDEVARSFLARNCLRNYEFRRIIEEDEYLNPGNVKMDFQLPLIQGSMSPLAYMTLY